jgi:hypothetical protein
VSGTGKRKPARCRDGQGCLEARRAELLPVTYSHNVFTLPHELNPLTLCNKKVIFDMLFRSVSETLLTFAGNPQNGLCGTLGFIAILHSWGQTLMDHFHLHCVIAAGALSFDQSRWIPAGEDFLFHVKALSRVFRGKFTPLAPRAAGRFFAHPPCLKPHPPILANPALNLRYWIRHDGHTALTGNPAPSKGQPGPKGEAPWRGRSFQERPLAVRYPPGTSALPQA